MWFNLCLDPGDVILVSPQKWLKNGSPQSQIVYPTLKILIRIVDFCKAIIIVLKRPPDHHNRPQEVACESVFLNTMKHYQFLCVVVSLHPEVSAPDESWSFCVFLYTLSLCSPFRFLQSFAPWSDEVITSLFVACILRREVIFVLVHSSDCHS